MNRTKIEYLDYTWSPCVGCSGLGCAVRKVCWARKQAKRQKSRCELCYSFVPHVHWERFDQPLSVKKPSKIGVCFSSDFFDKQFSESVRASLKIRMEKAFWHTFILLTKQPQHIDVAEPFQKNVWLGVTVNRKDDLWRLDAIRDIDVSVRFASLEPLYEDLCDADFSNIDWLIIGAQQRPALYPKYEWVLSLLQKRIPIFLKDNLLPIMATNSLRKEFPKS